MNLKEFFDKNPGLLTQFEKCANKDDFMSVARENNMRFRPGKLDEVREYVLSVSGKNNSSKISASGKNGSSEISASGKNDSSEISASGKNDSSEISDDALSMASGGTGEGMPTSEIGNNTKIVELELGGTPTILVQ